MIPWNVSLLRTLLCVAMTLLGGCALNDPPPMNRDADGRRLIGEGLAALRQGRLDEAETAFYLATEVADLAEAYDGLGSVLYAREEFVLAGEFFQKSIAMDPTYSDAYAHLAMVFDQLGLKERARQEYSKALALDPLNYQARNNYAVFLQESGLASPEEVKGELMKAFVTSKSDSVKKNIEMMEKRP